MPVYRSPAAATTVSSSSSPPPPSTGDDSSHSHDALISGLSGAGSGILALLLTYPLLTATTRQQTQNNTNTNTRTPPPPAVHRLSSLYDGLLPALIGTTASQGVYYYFYAYFTRRLQTARTSTSTLGEASGSTRTLGAGGYLAAASLAGAVNVVLTNPIWLIVTRLQVIRTSRRQQEVEEEVKGRRTVLSAVKDVVHENGLAGLWRGVLPSLVMVVNPAISYMLFETLMKRRRRRKGGADRDVWASFVNGAIAKLGATMITYPLQLVKSRLQAGVDDDGGGGGAAGDKRKGVFGTVQRILNEEGVQGFYRGLSTKICQSVFAAALLFAVQDALKASIVAMVNQGAASTPAARKRIAAGA